MHIEFLVEEPSMEATLKIIVPKILPTASFNIHNFTNKQKLIKKLPARLSGYNQWLPNDWKIVVLIDEDREDCKKLKERLENIAMQRFFSTKTKPSNNCFQIVNRIVIEELEAWFFGDIDAVRQAYPRVPDISKRRTYRDPDAIKGGTWESFERVLKKAGYHKTGLGKIKAAKDIAQYMNPEINKSKSFQVFREGLLALYNI